MQLVQVMFGGGNVPGEVAWSTMVLILKEKGGYWEIGMVEVLWKLCLVVVNFHLKSSIVLHDALHGFREGRGIGTATLDSKLAQQLAGIEHRPLFQVFLDVRNTCEFMDSGRFLKILRGYGLGKNLDLLLKNYWKRQKIVPNMGKCLGKVFGTGGVVTQGEPVSPMIFNIMVDAVVRAVLDVVCSPHEAQHDMG